MRVLHFDPSECRTSLAGKPAMQTNTQNFVQRFLLLNFDVIVFGLLVNILSYALQCMHYNDLTMYVGFDAFMLIFSVNKNRE